MDTTKQKCTCQNSMTNEESNLKSSKIVQTLSTDSDVFYDVPDENDSATPKTSSKLQRTSSVTVLMQKIADPQYFKKVLQNVVETAENLMNTFEGTMRESLVNFRKAIAGLTVPRNLSYQDDSQREDKFYSGGCGFCGARRSPCDGFNITVDPVIVTVPITLYIQPKIERDQRPGEFDTQVFAESSMGKDVEPTRSTGYEPTREDVLERSIFDKVETTESITSEAFVPHSISDEVEPIRTASISIADGRLSQAPFGLPKVIRFSKDITERQDSMTEITSEDLPEPEFEEEDSRKDLAEKEDFIGTVLVPPQELPMPQQKDLSLCVSCDCEQCPVYDLNKQIVCPRNCNCCICPWKDNVDSSLSYHQVRICQCYAKRNPDSSSPREHCQCLSKFDICPCRDVAESRHVELFGTDMYEDIFEIKK